MYRRDSILVVGGAGFIGSHLVNALSNLYKNEYKIIVVDPMYCESGIAEEWKEKVFKYRLGLIDKSNVTFINKSFYQAKDAIDWFSIDTVIHLGAIPLESTKGFEEDFLRSERDIDLTKDIIKNIQAQKFLDGYDIKMIFMSSLFAFGDYISYSASEDHRLLPKTPYGLTKAMGEHYIHTYLPKWNILRTTSVYGLGDSNLRATQIFLNAAQKGKGFWVNDQAWLDFTHISDLVSGIIRVIQFGKNKETYHISGGKAYSLVDYVRELDKNFENLDYEIRTMPGDRPKRGTLENTKMAIELDWYPKMDLKDGVAEYIYQSNVHGFA